MSEEAMTRIGDYEVLGVLGAGGMGKVFKVRNVISDRVEAMKVLLPDLAGRQELVDRFLREIKILAGLEHPNIAVLRTALTLENRLVMIMEFVEGTSLAKRLEQGPVSTADALNYVDQVLAALSYAHQRHVVHRDIKPANMMLTPEGVVKLMDFGIARSANDRGLTATGTTLGSLYYMSPEQVKGAAVDERSDLYSVGVSLYEMVTGQRPFQADSDFSIMSAHLQEAPKPPITLRQDLPPLLNEIILKSMAKDPLQRFQTADAFRNALRGQQNVPVAVPMAAEVKAGSATGLFQGGFPNAAPSAAAPVMSAEIPSPAATVPQVPPRQTGGRGLYITLGAVIVLVVLVAAGIFIPRGSKAGGGSQPSPSQAPFANTTGAQTSPATGSDTSSPAASATQYPAADYGSQSSTLTENLPAASAQRAASSGSGPQPVSKSAASLQPGATQQSSGPATQSASSTQNNATNRALLEELEQESDRLVSRGAAVDDSLNNLRRVQEAQGLGLRADISATQQRMRTYITKAQAALQKQDAGHARKYLDLAETEVANLEKFLGR